MTTQEHLEKKLRKLNTRYKTLGKAHDILCRHVELVRRELEGLQGRDVHLPPLVASLRVALYGAKRSHQSAALPAPLQAAPSPVPAATGPDGGQMSPVGPQARELAPLTPHGLPPVPPVRLLAGLRRARAALVTRQAQLAQCATCGTEAAAYQEAAADVDALMEWLGG